MKTKIYHSNCEICGEQDFFFDADGKLLTWWDRNDADYRPEYMNPLFDALGYKVVEISPKNKLIWSQVKNVLLDCGASEEEL